MTTARLRIAFTGELNSPVCPLTLSERATSSGAWKTDSNGAAKPPLLAASFPSVIGESAR